MNLKTLPKEKRNQLILVVLLTVGALAGLGFGLIKFQFDNLSNLAAKKAAEEGKLQKMEDTIKRAGLHAAELKENTRRLAERESGMASGDLFSWVINTLGIFKLPYKVEIPQYSGILEGEMSLLPEFPYKQAMLTVRGTAYYHDLGRFLADFENQFPAIRVLNLELDPAGAESGDREKLSFKMDIVALVKPNPS